MPTYRNGYVPSGLLVTFASGTNQDGYWEHQLSPGTLAKHRALVARASRRGALRLTPGWSCYRPFYWQQVAQRLYGKGAATPGTSSHGGFWEGRQTLAMDYHNWSAVYGGDQGAWFADCRAVGLAPGMIMRSRGYPDEPWHVIDLDPWAPVLASSGATPLTLPEPVETEYDMRAIKSPGRPWAVIGAGYIRELNDEEAANIVWPKHELNDRQWDLNRAAALGLVGTAPATGGMLIISAPNRPKTLIGAGYFRVLNDEEASNVGALAERVIAGNDRQYDLWVSIALHGQGASFPVAAGNLTALSDADVARLASAVTDEQDRRARERLNG